MRKTNYLQIVTFDLQRAAGPYRWATPGLMQCSKWLCSGAYLFSHTSS